MATMKHFHVTFEKTVNVGEHGWLSAHATKVEAQAHQRRSFHGVGLSARRLFGVKPCQEAACPPWLDRIDRATNGPLFR